MSDRDRAGRKAEILRNMTEMNIESGENNDGVILVWKEENVESSRQQFDLIVASQANIDLTDFRKKHYSAGILVAKDSEKEVDGIDVPDNVVLFRSPKVPGSHLHHESFYKKKTTTTTKHTQSMMTTRVSASVNTHDYYNFKAFRCPTNITNEFGNKVDDPDFCLDSKQCPFSGFEMYPLYPYLKETVGLDKDGNFIALWVDACVVLHVV